MVIRLYREQQIKDEVPNRLQVLWGDDGPDGRLVITSGSNLETQYRNHPSKKLAERDFVRSGRWLLVTYSRTGNRLSLRDYMEIRSSHARLKDGVIVHTDQTLLEEMV